MQDQRLRDFQKSLAEPIGDMLRRIPAEFPLIGETKHFNANTLDDQDVTVDGMRISMSGTVKRQWIFGVSIQAILEDDINRVLSFCERAAREILAEKEADIAGLESTHRVYVQIWPVTVILPVVDAELTDGVAMLIKVSEHGGAVVPICGY